MHSQFSIYFFDKRHKRKKLAPSDVHVPNSKEGKLLRSIKAKSGLTEKEIREIPKYQRMLANAQIQNRPKDRADRAHKRIMKRVTKQLGLPKEHPFVVDEFNIQWKKYIENKWY